MRGLALIKAMLVLIHGLSKSNRRTVSILRCTSSFFIFFAFLNTLASVVAGHRTPWIVIYDLDGNITDKHTLPDLGHDLWAYVLTQLGSAVPYIDVYALPDKMVSILTLFTCYIFRPVTLSFELFRNSLNFVSHRQTYSKEKCWNFGYPKNRNFHDFWWFLGFLGVFFIISAHSCAKQMIDKWRKHSPPSLSTAP